MLSRCRELLNFIFHDMCIYTHSFSLSFPILVFAYSQNDVYIYLY